MRPNFSPIRKQISYLEDVSILKAVLCLLIAPYMIILLQTDFVSPYIDKIIFHTSIILFGFLIINKPLRTFYRTVNGSWKETIKAAFLMLALSLLFKRFGAYFVGDNAQGVRDVTYDMTQYLMNTSLLPFIGFGEETFKLVFFIGVFSLVQGSLFKKVTIATLLTSALFGFLHGFGYPMASSVPIGLGGYPATCTYNLLS